MSYIESCMDFSPLFAQENSIYIEKSNFRERLGAGVKSVEFVTIRDSKLYFIEAKRSAPNPKNLKSKLNIAEYCQDLLEKAQHSLDLLASKELDFNKDLDEEFPGCFNEKKLVDYKIIFLLVINGHEKEWCSDIQEIVQRKLVALRKIWRIDVIVFNDVQAKSRNFIA